MDELGAALPAASEPVRFEQHIKPLFRRYDRQAIPCASTTSRAITASRVTGLCVLVCPSPARYTADPRPAASRI